LILNLRYGKGITEITRAEAKKLGNTVDDPRPENYKGTAPLQFWDENWVEGKWKKDKNAAEILEFMRFAALCHTVIIEEKGEEKMLSASSPDELALVDGMKHLGVEFYVI
jgi:magnesium-transporting ATPase (P-type)